MRVPIVAFLGGAALSLVVASVLSLLGTLGSVAIALGAVVSSGLLLVTLLDAPPRVDTVDRGVSGNLERLIEELTRG